MSLPDPRETPLNAVRVETTGDAVENGLFAMKGPGKLNEIVQENKQ